MHPQQLPDNKLVCREFFEALVKCHANGWRKFFGGCNKEKDLLNHCLRKTRIAKMTANLEASKLRNSKIDQARQDFRADGS